MWQSFWQSKYTLFTITAVGIIFRILALSQAPQGYDMGTFAAWGDQVWVHGLFATYQNVWSDYLPFPMLIFGLIRGLCNLTPLAFADTFRVFWLIIEAILIYCIHHNFRPKDYSLFTILWLFPPFLFNTGWWGQIDSIPTLLTVLALLLLQKSNKWGGALSFAMAVAIKPIMLITAPVFLILGWQKKSLLQLLIVGILTLTITALPAVVSNSLFITPSTPLRAFEFVIKQSAYQSSMYPDTTINGWNLWSVQGTFWSPDNIPILGLTAQQVGYSIFVFCAFYILRRWSKNNFDQSQAMLVSGQLLLCFYAFTTRMHERHLLFALPFLIVGSTTYLSYGISIVLSMLYVGNLWGALYWVNNAQVWPFPQWLLSIFSWLVVIITGVVAFRPHFNYRKYLLEILIIFIAIILRVANLEHPPAMIFDEVYHSFTAKEYLHNNVAAWEWWTTPPQGFAYEWTHPPIAKYGMVVGMFLFGENSFGWRIGSVVMGVASIIGIYFVTLKLTISRPAAQLAMFLVSIEGLHLVQSRIGMNDTYMLAFFVWSLVFALSKRWKASAILYGFALASKWSAIYGIIPLATVYLQANLGIIPNNKIIKSLFAFVITPIRVIAISIIVYLFTFVPFFLSGHTTEQFIELHRQMWYYHTHLVATHDYQSTPLQWIAVARPVWYWVAYGDGMKSNIYAQGNPTLLWFGLFSLIALVISRSKKYLIPIIICCIFTIPWFFSPRIMFFYHYLPTAFFLNIPSSIILTKLSTKWRIILISIFISTFIAFTPVYYGYPTNNQYWETLFRVFPSWK